MSEIDALLDSTLDDLADLPEFKNFNPGVHRVLATLSIKEVNGKDVIELSMKGMESLEMVNPTDEPIKEGDTSSVIFMLDNEFGVGNFKKIATPIAAALGTTTNRETIEQCDDLECLIVTSLRVDKNDKDRFYLNVKELNVV